MTYHFPIVIEKCGEGGFYGECPQIPGCHVQGETYEETLSELQSAIEGMIDDYIESGDPLPEDYPMLTVVSVDR